MPSYTIIGFLSEEEGEGEEEWSPSQALESDRALGREGGREGGKDGGRDGGRTSRPSMGIESGEAARREAGGEGGRERGRVERLRETQKRGKS